MLSSTPLDNEERAAAVAPVPGRHPHPKWFLNCVLPDFLPHLKGQWIQEAQKHSPGHSVGEPKSQDSDLNTPADLGHPCLPEERGTQLWASWEVPHGWPVSPDSVRSSTPQLFRLESAFPQTPRAECSFDCIIWIKTEGKTLGQVKVLAPFVTEAQGCPFWWEKCHLTFNSPRINSPILCYSRSMTMCLSVWICLSVFACFYVSLCIHVSVCVCLYVCMHAHTSMFVSICMCTCIWVCFCVCISYSLYMYMCVHTLMPLSVYMYMCVYMLVCICVYLCVYMCLSVCLCLCICLCLWVYVCLCVYMYASIYECLYMVLYRCTCVYMNKYVSM